ncbi:phosphoserine phosphatase SerB [Ahrensia sp. 13_GOM-1096m]|uniref:phosphoserine phosphatase SerB n=1 Tax=Ahrensia sp. 13_GOM-1096m TaxID=1380380 RepID=UPI00047E1EDB|nr:phosphoserine phosphatase SerB [Ahrensia sp. 13_GOM-1096m]
MSFFATLIAPQSSALITQEIALRCSAALNCEKIDWLKDGEALDLFCPNAEGSQIRQTILDIIGQAPIDIVIQPMDSHRAKKILIADMDSTMIRQECIDELAAEAGLKEQVSGITARAMNGEIEFDAALKERVALLKDLSVSVIDTVIATRIELMPGGVELVRTMRKNGAYCALVSGGFTEFTSRIAQMIGFQENRANTLLHANGKLTGKVGEPILGKQAKVDALNDIANRLGLTPNDAIAVGDGANDLGMLNLAGTGVALHAKPAVAAAADIRIDHSDLTALLYIQGYHSNEFDR